MIDGDDASVVHRIARSETLVGRGEETHFTIEDKQVSNVHCKIRMDGPVRAILDSGSRNGTVANGRRLAQNVAQRLRNLDDIEIGGHRRIPG